MVGLWLNMLGVTEGGEALVKHIRGDRGGEALVKHVRGERGWWGFG